jgi:hypothetical protein
MGSNCYTTRTRIAWNGGEARGLRSIPCGTSSGDLACGCGPPCTYCRSARHRQAVSAVKQEGNKRGLQPTKWRRLSPPSFAQNLSIWRRQSSNSTVLAHRTCVTTGFRSPSVLIGCSMRSANEHRCPISASRTSPAVNRIQVAYDSPEVLQRIEGYLESAFRRLFQQRNLLLHGVGSIRSLCTNDEDGPDTCRSGLDRLVYSSTRRLRTTVLPCLSLRARSTNSVVGSEGARQLHRLLG